MKLKDRRVHCAFAKLNRNGRCIAVCSHNKNRCYDTDCTGKEGITLDLVSAHEVRVTMGFIDGRGVVVDDKGYRKVDAPTVNRSVWKSYYSKGD